MLRVFLSGIHLKASSSIKKRRCLVNLVNVGGRECVGLEKVENGGRVCVNKLLSYVCIQ